MNDDDRHTRRPRAEHRLSETGAEAAGAEVVTCADCGHAALIRLLAVYGLAPVLVPAGTAIPGSFWGDDEAGLIGHRLYIRPLTPVHSALHEACHYVCMDETRRSALHTNAGGDAAEESAVCYLQVLVAEYLPGMGREQAFADMDAWGYSFRLGSARAWFEDDADDARQWLLDHDLIDSNDHPTWKVRR
jgi:hypothetical protein